ncbi:hypothetical protein PROVRUST_07504 [Providencia rustigianii DSM 4541]|uniref:Uncharacterized protein n=1 Tax=Providencia rustigianii DSM 4541 TaxID=500637 RepID=D1P5J6_9GAMM|nr:hypothetical protein PROVRUST_07504 [Providencia rustigianii DSM 4541]
MYAPRLSSFAAYLQLELFRALFYKQKVYKQKVYKQKAIARVIKAIAFYC